MEQYYRNLAELSTSMLTKMRSYAMESEARAKRNAAERLEWFRVDALNSDIRAVNMHYHGFYLHSVEFHADLVERIDAELERRK